MKISMILVTALAAGTLGAQAPEGELDARIQLFGEMVRPTSFSIYQGVKDQPAKSTGFGVRFMGEIASSRQLYYELGGKLDSSSNMTYTGTLGTGVYDFTDVKLTSSYWFIGTGYLVPLGSAVSLSFHLEMRGEALSAQGAVQQVGQPNVRVDCSTTYLRPWGRLSLDASFKLGKFRPYVGVDAAVTPLKTAQTVVLPSLQYMDDRTLRSTAPNVSGAFYVGMHF